MGCNKISQWEVWWILQEILFVCYTAGVPLVMEQGVLCLEIMELWGWKFSEWHFLDLLVCQATAFIFFFMFLEVQPEYIYLHSNVDMLLPFQFIPSTLERERGRADKTRNRTTLNSVLNTKSFSFFFFLNFLFLKVKRDLLDYLIWPWLALIN